MIERKKIRHLANYEIRELGAQYFIDRYADRFSRDKSYYTGCVKVRNKEGIEKWIPVIEGQIQYWPSESLLGFTDLEKIFLKPGLGYQRSKVLEHEKAHIADPDADEHTIRKRTHTLYLN